MRQPISTLSATVIVAGFVLLASGCFFSRERSGETTRPDMSPHVVGVIVPHHALVESLIDEIFATVAKEDMPKKVIIIGPNHREVGGTPVATSAKTWSMRGTTLISDSAFVDVILKRQDVGNEDVLLANEHAITTLLPSFQAYFPHATIVPLMVKHAYSVADAKALGAWLASQMDDETLLVASIDFSHYLPSDATDEKDAVTLSLIEKRNLEAIRTLNNDYLDSPASLIAFLSAMDMLGANLELVHHTNSGEYLGEPLLSSTSYLTFVARVPTFTEQAP